jgi:hypothetical protein
MAFCSNCGTRIDEEMKFCPKCGISAIAEPNMQSEPVEDNSQLLTVLPVNEISVSDKNVQAITSLVLGIVGLLSLLFEPLVALPVTIIGLITGVIGQKSTKKNMATAGLILSIIGLVVTIIKICWSIADFYS